MGWNEAIRVLEMHRMLRVNGWSRNEKWKGSEKEKKTFHFLARSMMNKLRKIGGKLEIFLLFMLLLLSWALVVRRFFIFWVCDVRSDDKCVFGVTNVKSLGSFLCCKQFVRQNSSSDNGPETVGYTKWKYLSLTHSPRSTTTKKWTSNE